MISLHRDFESEHGTFGKLYMDSKEIAHTLELPWKDNKRMVSCIPKGTYKVKRRWSPRYKHHWILKDVPNRTYILIHHGNWMKNSQGCILVGDRYLRNGKGEINGVGNSVPTMNKLRQSLPDEFSITIL